MQSAFLFARCDLGLCFLSMDKSLGVLRVHSALGPQAARVLREARHDASARRRLLTYALEVDVGLARPLLGVSNHFRSPANT